MDGKFLNPTNAVGDKINKENRLKATEVLKLAKQIEADLIQNGAIWMKKERSSVLVPKEKIKEYKLNGFK